MRRTRDVAYAEDLLQQTFLQMHAARRHFAPGTSVAAWSFAIARRLLIDGGRKSARRGSTFETRDEYAEVPSPDAPPDHIAARRRLAARIDAELMSLPETHREAFELVQYDGLSMAEAAALLGTTVAAVKLRAHRTYEALRARLGDAAREELEEFA
jgi:RNA polymerase sigma-70 factor (ECF subfamily)